MPPTLTSANFLTSTPSRSRLVHHLFPVAVLDADGWPRAIADEDILAQLLTRNLARAAAQDGAAAAAPSESDADEGE
jgi:hypothetical protein